MWSYHGEIGVEGRERGGETGDEQRKGTGGGRGEENGMWVCRGGIWKRRVERHT